MLRGTLRSFGFCDAWNILVQLGCCDDTYMLSDTGAMTHLDFINSFLGDGSLSTEQKIASQFDLDLNGPEIQKLRWSGFFDDTLIEPDKGTPAQIVESILNRKWKLYAHDKDMIVMYHRFVFEKEGSKKEIQASLVVKGDNAVHTAMAKTVGLPLGIAAKLLLLNKISERGVCIPINPEFYNPILAELKTLGVELDEKEMMVANA
jgi:saccharopine dehydrogenase (NADP+, L-glutamate forming)